jgi:probable F420-dependent oxidoreductase
MQIGIILPQNEIGHDPGAIREFAAAAEDEGFAHVVAFDHVVGKDDYAAQPFHEPFVLFGFIAACTRTIELTTGIIILPQRQTVLVARQAADLDLFSGGRFRLGVGVGWNYVEYDALGQDFHTRGKRQEEQIALLRRLWSEDVVSFDGRFDRVDRAALLPKPSAPVPIWMGGYGPAAFGRAARIADGFIFGGRTPNAIESWQQMQELLAGNDRRVEDFGAEMVMFSTSGPDRVAEHIGAWDEAGGTHASVSTMNHGFTDVEQHVDYLDQVRQALGR